MRNAKEVSTKEVYEVIPQGETLLCLESARQKDVFFAGGGTSYRLKDGNAKLFAFCFDGSLEVISSMVLRNESGASESMGVSCMTRIAETDTILVGTNSNLFVVEFHHNNKTPNASHFGMIHRFPGVHSWLITSIDYHIDVKTNCLEAYSVSRKDQHLTKIVLQNFKSHIPASTPTPNLL